MALRMGVKRQRRVAAETDPNPGRDLQGLRELKGRGPFSTRRILLASNVAWHSAIVEDGSVGRDRRRRAWRERPSSAAKHHPRGKSLARDARELLLGRHANGGKHCRIEELVEAHDRRSRDGKIAALPSGSIESPSFR